MKYEHLLTPSIFNISKSNIKDTINLFSNYGIDDYITNRCLRRNVKLQQKLIDYMLDNNIPLINGIASLTGLVLMQTLVSYLALKSRKFNSFLSGKPSILINKGKVDEKELKRERITIDELLEQLRVLGYFNLKDIQYYQEQIKSILLAQILI